VQSRGFTLVELIVVVAVIAILTALLLPVFASARLKAKVARVHSDLRQIGIAIEAYREDWGGYPPVRESCRDNAAIDYYEMPRELYRLHYIGAHRMLDPFNRVRGEDGKDLGRTYKYVAIGWGYSNDSKTVFGMWIPRDYPLSSGECVLYYPSRGQVYRYPELKPCEPPIRWAVWSVGPGGDPGWQESGARQLPVPKREWYPWKENGVIVRASDGRKSP